MSSHLGQRSIDAADLGTLALHEVDLVGCEAHGSRRMRGLDSASRVLDTQAQ